MAMKVEARLKASTLDAEAVIDIVIGTRDRPKLLKRTIGHIVARTRSRYRLYVIDDASGGTTAAYLTKLCEKGVVTGMLRRTKRAGISANLRSLLSITRSDPIVFTDDDVLCPDVEPDWLARELAVMTQYPRLGVLSLNNPQASRTTRCIERGPEVTFYQNVGGVFAMIRRSVLETVLVPNGPVKPMRYLCLGAIKAGFTVGCLTDIYCQHIGAISIRVATEYSATLGRFYPTDGKTLQPPKVNR